MKCCRKIRQRHLKEASGIEECRNLFDWRLFSSTPFMFILCNIKNVRKNGCLSPIIKDMWIALWMGWSNAILKGINLQQRKDFRRQRVKKDPSASLRSFFFPYIPHCVHNCMLKYSVEGWISLLMSGLTYDPLWIFVRIKSFIGGGFAWIFMIDLDDELFRFFSFFFMSVQQFVVLQFDSVVMGLKH